MRIPTLLKKSATCLCLLFASQLSAQNGNICDGFDNNVTSWAACASGPNISHRIEPSGGPVNDSFLRVEDGSGPSSLCSGLGAINGSMQSPYTGNWLKMTGECKNFCFDVKLIYGGHLLKDTATYHPNISIYSNSKRYNFVADILITPDGGNNGGWHRVCPPITTIKNGAKLPSNSHGKWRAYNATTKTWSSSYDNQWNSAIMNVETLELPIDFSGSPTEVIGYDNICLGECIKPIKDCRNPRNCIEVVGPFVPNNEFACKDGSKPPCKTKPNLCCTPWTKDKLKQSFSYVFDTSSGMYGNFTLKYQDTTNTHTQMKNYITYLKSIYSIIDHLNVIFRVSNHGNGIQPSTNSTSVPSAIVSMNWTSNTSPQTPIVLFNGYPLAVNNWYRLFSKVSLYDVDNKILAGLIKSEECINAEIYFRMQVQGHLRVGSGKKTGMVLQISDGKKIIKTIEIRGRTKPKPSFSQPKRLNKFKNKFIKKNKSNKK